MEAAEAQREALDFQTALLNGQSVAAEEARPWPEDLPRPAPRGSGLLARAAETGARSARTARYPCLAQIIVQGPSRVPGRGKKIGLPEGSEG